MKYYLAIFSSITFANKIKKILSNTPGFIALMHTPSSLNENGCSYCLRFKEDKLSEVKSVAYENNIKIKSIYLEDINGYTKIQ